MISFSIIVPTIDRPTLARTLESIQTQPMMPQDELIIIRDDPPHSDWGCWARTQGIFKATGSHLIFMDDDDIYTPGALPVMRELVSIAPATVHIFRMMHPDIGVVWKTRNLVSSGDVGTPMAVVPREFAGTWTEDYAGDFNFIKSSVKLAGGAVAWHEHVVCECNPGK